jgi:DNA topoisomerase-1
LVKGRFGPYVTDGSVNATVPRGRDPLALTLDEALTLIAERAAKGPSKKSGKAKKQAKAKPEKMAKAPPKKKSAKRKSAPAAGK